MHQDFTPKLISGIGKWELFPGMFIVGNAQLDRYIRVPAASVQPVWRAIQYSDGNRSCSEIVSLILAAGWKLDVAELYRKLTEAGLVAGSEYVSDLSRISVKWGEARISGLFPVWPWWGLVSHLFTAAMFLSVVAAAVVWFVCPVTTPRSLNFSGLELVVAMFAGAGLSIVIHETAHALAACAEGLTPARVRFLGYLGVIPYILLSIPGLYTIRPAGRLRVWFAGPLASLSLASCCYLASGLEIVPMAARIWLDRMSLANTLLAVWNCCPLLPTDGYFIVSTLLKQANWRIRSWRELSSCVGERRRPQLLLSLYAFGSSLGLAFLSLRNINHILKVTNFSWFGYAAVLLLVLMFVFKQVALKRRRVAESNGGHVTC